MEEITLKFPDGKSKKFRKGIMGKEILKSLPQAIRKAAVGIKVENNILGLSQPILDSGNFLVLTFNDEEGKNIFWHSSAHVLATAIKHLFPKALPAIGPAIKDGFYYDFYNLQLSTEDFTKIEKEVKKTTQQNNEFIRKEISKLEALKLFKNNKFKTELIKDLEKPSIYSNGDFTDLCRGPHLLSTGVIKAFKLTKLSGAYWRADSKKEQLTRIYGISFPKQDQLNEHLKHIEEAEKRDHRKIGQQLNLFSFHDEGPGFVFWHPNGMIIYNELLDFWKEEHRKAGYQLVMTPIILSKKLWVQSGHWSHYKENMYFTKIDNEDYAVKPMNCPGGILIYKTNSHSYKEFPLRIGEVGLVHRHELSGVLHGLFRVRSFWQDDAHIYCLPDQLEQEIVNVISLVDKFYKLFGFNYSIELSTRPDDSMGKKEVWDKAELILKSSLRKAGKKFKINEGDGAFYGPKIDFHIEDSMGRTWQCGTCQLDFQMPEKFDLTYMGKDGVNNHRPIMLHRVIYGSMERFIGILIEHFAGKLPLWLSPYQVRVITIGEKFNGYAKKVNDKLFSKGFRSQLDDSANTVGKKIREAQMDKVNYMVVIGEKEYESKTIAVRNRNGKSRYKVKLNDFIEDIEKEIKNKNIFKG
jgi:threonyl-tRNA synthetase